MPHPVHPTAHRPLSQGHLMPMFPCCLDMPPAPDAYSHITILRWPSRAHPLVPCTPHSCPQPTPLHFAHHQHIPTCPLAPSMLTAHLHHLHCLPVVPMPQHVFDCKAGRHTMWSISYTNTSSASVSILNSFLPFGLQPTCHACFCGLPSSSWHSPFHPYREMSTLTVCPLPMVNLALTSFPLCLLQQSKWAHSWSHGERPGYQAFFFFQFNVHWGKPYVEPFLQA